MATKSTIKLAFVASPRVPHGPNSGFLFALWPRAHEAFLPNSVSKTLDTGVTIDVPSGTTVRVRGLFENEQRNVKVTPMDIHGPVRGYPLRLSVWNMANATIKMDADKPFASIQAHQTPKQSLWEDDSDAPASAADLMGSKSDAA